MTETPPPRIVKPSDAELERLGIVWVDERGVTSTGLPYPASSDPVANGAANIQALAQAIDLQGPASLGTASTPGATVGSVGPVNWTSQLVIAAAPFKRLIQAHMMGYVTSIGTSGLFFNFRVNGTDIRRIEIATAKQSGFSTYTWELAANTSATVQGTAQSLAGNAIIPADGRFAWLSVYSLGGIT